MIAPTSTEDLLVLADDLTGAAETAGAILAVRPGPSVLHLTSRLPRNGSPVGRLLVRDLNLRALSRTAARRGFRQALRSANSMPLFVKVDSLLRGSASDMVAELRRCGLQTVICVAHPARGRIVADGVVHVDGVPLHRTRMWSVEQTAPPQSVAEAIGVVVEPVPRPQGPMGSWGRVIEQSLQRSGVAICDAVDEGEIAQIGRFVTDAWAAGRPVVGMGAAPLARSVAMQVLPPHDAGPERRAQPGAVLVVVGTNDPIAEVQIGRLLSGGARHISLSRRQLATRARRSQAARSIAHETTEAVCVVSVDGRSGWTDADLRRFACVAADAAHAADVAHLVLTGGATARSVLDELKIARLRPLAEMAGETMLSRTEDGRSIVTRPGSFGGPEGLVQAVAALPSRFPLSMKE